MKKIIFFILNISFISLYAQPKNRLIIADSITHDAVPYAGIAFGNAAGGTYSNADGWCLVADSIKIVEISSVGYNTRKIYTDNNYDTIFLQPRIYTIEEASIYAGAKKLKQVELGYVKKKRYTSMSYQAGDEIAVYIPVDKDENSYRRIKQVIFKERTAFSKLFYNEDYSSVFKVNFYTMAEDGKIGEIINSRAIVFTSDNIKATTKLDVSQYDIYMPDKGIFAAIEFVGKINPDTKEIITNTLERIPPAINTSWKEHNAIVYEKKLFFGDGTWHKVDENHENVVNIKTLDKTLKKEDFYTPLISIVME